MRYAIIENDTVVNIAVGNRELHGNWILIPIGSPVMIGDTYDGQLFYAPDGGMRMTPEQAYASKQIGQLEEELRAAKILLGVEA